MDKKKKTKVVKTSEDRNITDFFMDLPFAHNNYKLNPKNKVYLRALKRHNESKRKK